LSQAANFLILRSTWTVVAYLALPLAQFLSAAICSAISFGDSALLTQIIDESRIQVLNVVGSQAS
jgi:hypothetical protein